MAPLKIEGVSQLSNMRYEDNGIRVWKAFDIGPGKIIPTSKLQSPSPSELPATIVNSTTPNSFVSFKRRQMSRCQDQEREEDESEEVDDGHKAGDGIFTCPEEGCTQTFLRHSSMQRHLDCGKHQRTLERETLLDRAALGYAEALEGQTPEVPHLETAARPVSPQHVSTLSIGWALKTGGARRARFTPNQKSYLDAKFKMGEQSGHKADPASVARAMITARDTNGTPLFTSDDFLTATQIASYFSRLASKKTLPDDDDGLLDDFQSATNEEQIDNLIKMAEREVGLTHPITYDVYNLCDMCSSSKLNNFSVPLLRDICASFDIDISDVAVRRKKPYIDRITSLCKSCTCQQ